MQLKYTLINPQNKATLVFLHGMGSKNSRTSWDSVIPLLETNFRLLTVDLRGHGESPRAESYQMAEFAQDVAELLDHLGIHKAIIIGHSMGGIVALNLGYLRPDIVQGLVIEDSPMPPPNQANNQATEAEKNSPLADNADYNSVERPMILGELMRPNPDWFVNLAEMKMPTLVIGGGDLSLYVNQSQLISLAEKLTNGKFIEIPVGHNIHQDAPDIFSSAVSKFAITNNLST